MNILHFISAPAAGGAEIYVKDLAKQLQKQGHSLHIGFLSNASDAGRSVQFENAFLADLVDSGIKYFFVGSNARRLPFLGALRVRKYVQVENIDIYHAHLTYGIIFGALIHIPRVYTHHNVRMRVNRLVFRILGNWIDQLVAISNQCGLALAQHAGRPVVVIRNGVDAGKIRPVRVVLMNRQPRMHCVAVGAITRQKNYPLLVTAISRLPSDVRASLRVAIAGEGPEAETEDLKSAIAKAGLEETVELLGNVDNIPDLLKRSHLFVMSSAWEGLPIALIEASMTGLPCIVTDVGSCREVIETCRNGLVVRPDDAQDLADAIERLYRARSRLTDYSDNALKYSPAFSIEKARDEHLSIYENIGSKNDSVAVS